MKELYHVIYEKEVKNDINKIKRVCSYRYYNKIISEIRKKINMLKYFPKITKTLYSFKDKKGDYRRAVVKKYIIIYKVEDNAIKILRIFNGRENYLNSNMFILKEESIDYKLVC